jgi:hypothetical protein
LGFFPESGEQKAAIMARKQLKSRASAGTSGNF